MGDLFQQNPFISALDPALPQPSLFYKLILGRQFKDELASSLEGLGNSRNAYFLREYASACYRIPQIKEELTHISANDKRGTKRLQSELSNLTTRLSAVDTHFSGMKISTWPRLRAKLGEINTATRKGVSENWFGELKNDLIVMSLTGSPQLRLASNKSEPLHLPPEVTKNERLLLASVNKAIRYMEAYAGRYKRTTARQHSPLDAATVIRVCREEHFPIELFLALALVETGGGILELGARTKNPLNFGNDEAGNTQSFKTWEDGIRGCIRGMRRAGFRGEFSTTEDILFQKQLVGFYGDYCAAKGAPYATKELPSLIRELLAVMIPKRRDPRIS